MKKKMTRTAVMMIACLLAITFLSVTSLATVPEDVQTDEQHCSEDNSLLNYVPESPATCTVDGTAAHYVCRTCGQKYDSELIPFTEMSHLTIPAHHTPGEVVGEPVIIPATCQEPGSKTLKVKCTVCENEYEITETIPVINHDLELVPAKDATCETPGNQEYYVCKNCKEWFLTDEVLVEDHNSLIIPAKGHTAGTAVTEHETMATAQQEGCYESVIYCTVCGKEISRTKETLPKLNSATSSGEDAARAAAEAARAEAEAARAAAEAAAAGNIPFEPATISPAEQPTRPASAPVPVPAPMRPEYAPMRPEVPVSPVATPAKPTAVNYSVDRIEDVDAFVDSIIADISADGKALSVDSDTLKAVINGVNVSDPTQEPMSVEEAVKALEKGFKTYHGNGNEEKDMDIDLTEYHFLCALEYLKLQKKQTTDSNGKPLPFVIEMDCTALFDLKAENIENTMMMVYDPASGETALIQLDEDCVDVSKRVPKLKVTLPFPGLYTFIQK